MLVGQLVGSCLLLAPTCGRATSPSCCSLPEGLSFRFGEPSDTLPIAAALLREKMNPLSLDHSRFVVCETATGERVGFGQIRELAPTKTADSSRFDAAPGSGDLEADADDDAWDDLERSGSVPSGLDSLPWSPGYAALQERAALQRARRLARVEQASIEAEPLWELASIYVEPGWRGCGVGRALVSRLLRRHAQRGFLLSDVYLLTLEPTCSWYEGMGFERIGRPELVPAPMAFEVAAGTALSFLLGNKLVCMRGRQ